MRACGKNILEGWHFGKEDVIHLSRLISSKGTYILIVGSVDFPDPFFISQKPYSFWKAICELKPPKMEESGTPIYKLYIHTVFFGYRKFPHPPK